MAQTRTIDLGQERHIRITLDGPEGAPWVVFSNSVMTDLGVWDGQIAALSNRYRVLRYDQRGHGGSSVPAIPLTFEDYGADLRQILDSCGVKTCTFVGLSMGVPTGLAAFAQAPEQLNAFVAVDGVSRSAPGREAFWTDKRDVARTAGMETIAAGTVPRWLPGAAPEDPKAIALSAMIAATPVEGFAAATHALQSYDHSETVPLLNCPVLGIAGALDGAMPDAVRAQFSAAPNARFADIAGAGHLPNFQEPAAFNDVLVPFLDAITTQTTKETA